MAAIDSRRLGGRAATGSRLSGAYGLRLFAGELSTPTILVFATAVGFLLRLYFVATASSFPLGDGGMFASMIDDLRRAHYALPQFTSYNGGNIPFAYPPLPFYAGAGLADLTGLSTDDVLRFLPLIVTTLTVPAFYLLARALLPTKSMAVMATFFFAVTPAAFDWQILGGGLTRSFGFLFTTLAWYHTYKLTRESSLRRIVPAAALSALTLACHLEWAWIVAFSYAVFLIGYARGPKPIIYAALAGAGAMILTAPWWALSISRHGLPTFIAAFHSGSFSSVSPLHFLALNTSHEAYMPLIAALALIGMLLSFMNKRPFLPLWLAAIYTFDTRAAAAPAAAVIAMLAAYAAAHIIHAASAHFESDGARPGRGAFLVPAIVVAYVFIFSMTISEGTPLNALPPSQREAMAWVAQNTPADSRFVVFPQSKTSGWASDAGGEWFPNLADRYSVSTVQGTEWLSGRSALKASVGRYRELGYCADRTVECLAAWSRSNGVSFSHVYITKPETRMTEQLVRENVPHGNDCCAALRNSLAASRDYERIYDGPDEEIYALRTPSATARP